MTKGIYKRGDVYWIRYVGPHGKMIRESVKSPRFKDAEAKLTARKEEVRKGIDPTAIIKTPTLIFKQLAVDYEQWCERQRSSRSKKSLIKGLVEAFGNIELRRFNTKMIEQFQSERLLKGIREIQVSKTERRTPPNKPATITRLEFRLAYSRQATD